MSTALQPDPGGLEDWIGRTLDRVGAYRQGRDHDHVLGAAADEDLRRLLGAPRSADTDFAVGWLCYCRFLSLGNAAEPGIMEALTRFQPFYERLSEQLPRSIVALARAHDDAIAAPGSALREAALYLGGVEERIKALPEARTPEPHDVLLAELSGVLDCLEAGDPQHNLALGYVAQVLRTRFHTFGDPGDLDTAILCARDAVNHSRFDDTYVHTYISNLSAALCDRCEIGREREDIDDAVAMAELGLRFTAAGHPDRGAIIHGYASARRLEDPARDAAGQVDAEHADLLREAVRAALPGHSKFVDLRHSLVRALLELYKRDDDARTLAEAAACLEEAGRELDTNPSPEARALHAVLRERVATESAPPYDGMDRRR